MRFLVPEVGLFALDAFATVRGALFFAALFLAALFLVLVFPAALLRAAVFAAVVLRPEVVLAALVRVVGRVLDPVFDLETGGADDFVAGFRPAEPPRVLLDRLLASPIAAPTAAAAATATSGFSFIATAAFFTPLPAVTAASLAALAPSFHDLASTCGDSLGATSYCIHGPSRLRDMCLDVRDSRHPYRLPVSLMDAGHRQQFPATSETRAYLRRSDAKTQEATRLVAAL